MEVKNFISMQDKPLLEKAIFEIKDKSAFESFLNTHSNFIKGKDFNGNNLLHHLASHSLSHDATVMKIQVLMAKGADLTQVNNAGETPLHIATLHTIHHDVVRYVLPALLQKEAGKKVSNFNSQDNLGKTILH